MPVAALTREAQHAVQVEHAGVQGSVQSVLAGLKEHGIGRAQHTMLTGLAHA